MDDFALARTVHVVAVLFWIGGVGFVTWVLMPTLKAAELPQDRLRRFSADGGALCTAGTPVGSACRRKWPVAGGARRSVEPLPRRPVLVDAPDMVALWTVFALMLLVIEPLHLHRRLANTQSPEADFARVIPAASVITLPVSIITILGAVGGSRGLF